MSNTANKLEYQEQMEHMTSLSEQAFANIVWDDPKKAMDLHAFWENFCHGKSKEEKTLAELEMRRIEAALLKMTDINCGFLGVQANSYIDAVGQKADTGGSAIKAEIEEIMPEKQNENKADEAKSEDKSKTVSLFNGKDMGDKPERKALAEEAKSLLAAGKKEDAISFAKQYLGTGNYTPKAGKPANPWEDKQINSWIRSLEIEVNKTKGTPKTVDDTFGEHKSTLEKEEFALNDFAERYVRLATAGSEDATAAEQLAALFFKHRNYSDKQIDVWKQTVTSNDSPGELNHFSILGTMGTTSAQLQEHEKSYEEISKEILDFMQTTQLSKDILGNKDAIIEFLEKEVTKKFGENLKNTSFTNKNGAIYEMWTPLHVNDFLSKMVNANFTMPSSQDTDSSEDSSTDADNPKDSFEEAKAKQHAADKKKSSIGNSVKAVTISIIRNGGILEDAIGNTNYADFIGEDKEFKTVEDCDKHITENFEQWAVDFKNSLKDYPYSQFMHALAVSFESEVPVEEFIEEAKTFMKKPNGKYLALVSKKGDVETHFQNDQHFAEWVKTQYREDPEKVVEAVQKDDSKEDKSEKRDTEESKSGEAPKSENVSGSGPTIKVSYIENVCNRAIKKGKGIDFLLKDRKISSLIEKGGVITSGDRIQAYDTTSDSFDKLQAHLKQVFDKCNEKKNGTTNKGTSVVDKVKNIVNKGTGEESAPEEKTEEETTVEKGEESVDTDPSNITSFNQIKEAGAELIKGGISKGDLLQWGYEVLLNRVLDENKDGKPAFTKADSIDTFMKSLFANFFNAEEAEDTAEEESESEDGKLTVEHLTEIIRTASTEEGMTYVKLCNKAKNTVEKSTLEMTSVEVLKLVRDTAPELYNAWKEEKNKKAEEEQVIFVPEKLSETNPTVWDKVKEFTTLGEIYSHSIELSNEGEWQTALNMAIELIKSGNIEGAEGWNDEQITAWFDTNVLKKEVVEETEAEIVEETSDESLINEKISNINSKSALRKALLEIYEQVEDSDSVRKQIISAIRGDAKNVGKKITSMSNVGLHAQMSAAIPHAKR